MTNNRLIPLLATTLATSLTSQAAVPIGDVTLAPVVSDNLPVFFSLTGYTNTEARMGSYSQYETPMYTPYESDQGDWWDNLLAEQLQARMPVMMLGTRGARDKNNSSDLRDTLNPYQLFRLNDALDRAGVTPAQMKMTCFVDTQPAVRCYNRVQGRAGNNGNIVDFSDKADVLETYWDYCIKPWFDTIRRDHWFQVKMGSSNRPIIMFWNFNPQWTNNTQGNVSALLTGISNKFEAAYGIKPCFNLPIDLIGNNQDTTVATQPDVYGFHDWFSPSNNESWTIIPPTVANGAVGKVGHMVPAFANSSYYNPNSTVYLDPDFFVSRKGISGTGVNGDTMLEGLNEAMIQSVNLMSVEGWTDDVEHAGLYRSNHVNWTNPNQYINLMRRYNDLRTETLRLEFEGCDAFSDTTTGNAGNTFRREGNLDIQKKPAGQSGWSVGWTAVGEWMEFRNIYLAPGTYTFPINYAAGSGDRKVTLSITGTAPASSTTTLPIVTLPSTGGTSIYDTHGLGTVVVSGGEYSIRVTTNTATGLNLDWLFVKRKDISVALQSRQNAKYARAIDGGGDIVAADRTAIGNHEKFIICDRNGGSLVSGDFVNLQCHNGTFLSATGAGGSILEANRMSQGTWERFQILKASGTGTITTGTDVVFKSFNNTSYLNVASSGTLDVSGTGVVAATRFTIGF